MTELDDLIKRLRQTRVKSGMPIPPSKEKLQAADAIERLRRELEQARTIAKRTVDANRHLCEATLLELHNFVYPEKKDR